jgi:hypothetical protein
MHCDNNYYGRVRDSVGRSSRLSAQTIRDARYEGL